MSFLRIILLAAVASALASLAVASAEAATIWHVVPGESSIGFSGTHAGRQFTGTFQKWHAEIAFDPQDLATSQAKVMVDLASAQTGDATYDKTLPTADWFNVSQVAQATFVTKKITGGEDGKSFTAHGTLSIRGVEVPVDLDFTFSESGDEAHLEGKTSLQRLAFGIGKGSDATGAWVSLDIPVTVNVKLKRGS